MGVHPAIADVILAHGDKKKSLQSLHMTISDDDPIRAIYAAKLDIGETEMRVRRSRSACRMDAAASDSLNGVWCP